MTKATLSDLDVQDMVRDELEWVPDVDSAGIGVSVEEGAVTLSGEVDSYAEKLAAKSAALRVRGVRTVADDLIVRSKGTPPSEIDIVREVDHALKTAVNVPRSVQAEVTDHHVLLIGEAAWEYQRHAAQHAVQYLPGVYTISNMIRLTQRPSAPDTQQRIADALTRHAQLDAESIHVAVEGSRVTLTGIVHSWAESAQAADAAWASPHVTEVLNHLIIKAF
ncbi:BON domain-containing protein [Microbacterium rhizosphaerae]|uniref:BON domain-containing protein n=1 Tax=Microbacterium rhizosphaerae TaxID=1678237 RepID=A0ABZ0SGM6_9MICO|nr:BON domain-containing protein [Microbacterium rhizosphaerae]WPR88286.1 BON domain-containing protein [Microbacterium rhizosphaerae]